MKMKKNIRQTMGKHSSSWVRSFLPGREAQAMYGKSSIADVLQGLSSLLKRTKAHDYYTRINMIRA